jgi:DNA (cytosine-5)-methyltransferase 1
MKYFSMFSGIGGFEYGIEKATESMGWLQQKDIRQTDSKDIKKQRGVLHKWECIGFSEIDKYAIQTYKKHYPTHKNWGSARDIIPEELPDFDMLCGGFPCQSFSIAGKRKGFQDTRGTLFHEICRIVGVKKPRLLFLENVKGLLSADNGRCFATIIQTLDELGYNVEWQVLNSKNFGVPQNRERVFIIGHLRGTSGCQIFPIGQSSTEFNTTSRETREDGERLWDYSANTIAQRDYKGGNQVIMHCMQQRSANRPSILKNKNAGGTGHLSKNDGSTYCLDGGNTQAVEIMGTVTEAVGVRQGSSKEYISSVEKIKKTTGKIRRLTPIECERLQGFEDNWTEGVSDTQRYKQCGNAVTTNVITAIMEKINEIK